MKDRSDEIAQFVKRYDDLDFVSLRIQDAFDPSWWERTGGKSYPSELGVTLGDEGVYAHLSSSRYSV